MKKPTPNPPESEATPDTTSPYASVDSKKLHEAADRALDFYLNPTAHIMSSANEPEAMYFANPRYNTESLLATPAKPSARPLKCSTTSPPRCLLHTEKRPSVSHKS